MNIFSRIMWQLMAVVVMLALGAGAAQASGGTPIAVEPDSAAPTGQATGPETSDADDPPIPPDAAAEDFYIYVSAPGNGSVGGIDYADEDIMVYNTVNGQWTKALDGTNAGVPASVDIDALDYSIVNLHSLFYMSFDKPVTIPGLGTVDDSDVVLRSCFLGGCSWTLFFDGSAHDLTTNAEDIDAIDVSGSNLWFSTTGGFAVPKYGGGTLKGGDEDIIVFSAQANAFVLRLDGSAKGLAAGNDLKSFDLDRHFAPDRDWIFMTFEDPFTYQQTTSNSVTGVPNDIMVDEMPNGGSGGAPRTAILWDASAAGFPLVDAIELIEQ